MKFSALMHAVLNFMPTLARLGRTPEPKRFYGRIVRLPESRASRPATLTSAGRCFRNRKQSGMKWAATYMGRRIGG